MEAKIRERLQSLSRYIGTSNYIYVEQEINDLLDRLGLLLNPTRGEWDC